MDRAIDIATSEETTAREAFRQRFRYRCSRCRAFVAPCIGKKRRYFRHEQGAVWCPEMDAEKGEGAGGEADFTRPLRRLLLDQNDDWSVKDTTLNVISFSCDLNGSKAERHVHEVTSMTQTKASFFVQPGFGGMQLGNEGNFHSNEPYFFLKEPRAPELPDELRKVSRRHGIEKDGATLYRLSPLDEWEADPTGEWLESAGLKPSLRPRYRWQVESDLAGMAIHSGQRLSALVATQVYAGHHVSLFLSSPTDADWTIYSNVDDETDDLPSSNKRIVTIECTFNEPLKGELYARLESDIGLKGEWQKPTGEVAKANRKRSFSVSVGKRLEIRVILSG